MLKALKPWRCVTKLRNVDLLKAPSLDLRAHEPGHRVENKDQTATTRNICSCYDMIGVRSGAHAGACIFAGRRGGCILQETLYQGRLSDVKGRAILWEHGRRN